MTEDRAAPESAIPEDEPYETPEVSDFGSLVELTRSGHTRMTDMAGFAAATASGGGSGLTGS
jgi:hypothetical protein